MSSPFTLTIDWLAFTLPSGPVQDTMQMVGGDWTKSKTGFRGYPASWITAGAGRGVGKLGTGPPVRRSKCMWICQAALSPHGQRGRSVRCSNGF